MDAQSRFQDMFAAFGYPKSVLHEMYEEIRKRYQNLDAAKYPGYPFAFSGEPELQLVPPEDCAGQVPHSAMGDAFEVENEYEHNSNEVDTTIRVDGYFLHATLRKHTDSVNAVNYSVEALPDEYGTHRTWNFFLSHEGIDDAIHEAPGCSPYILFTRKNALLVERDQMPVVNRARRNRGLQGSSCSSWIVLRPRIGNPNIFQKLSVLRCDEKFNRQWVKAGRLVAELRTGDITIEAN